MCKRFISFIILSLLLCVLPSQSQWYEQSIPSDINMILTVDFSDTNYGAAGGYSNIDDYSGRAIYTTNGGVTWINAFVPESTRAIVTLRMFNKDIGYAIGAVNLDSQSYALTISQRRNKLTEKPATKAIGVNDFLRRIGVNNNSPYKGLFLQTINGGQTWVTKGSLPDSVSYAIGASFIDSNIGYITVDIDEYFGNARILKTTDGGNSWRQLSTPDSIVSLRNISFIDSLHGLAVGYKTNSSVTSGLILRTEDGGENWQATSIPSVDNFTDVQFVDSMRAYAVGIYSILDSTPHAGAVYTTLDGGLTWSPLSYKPELTLFHGVRFIGETGIIFGNSIDEIPMPGPPFFSIYARTTDNGSSWSPSIIMSASEKLLVGGKLLSPLNAYICGGFIDDEAIMLHTSNGGITDVPENEREISSQFKLFQNYPNPFNPATNFTLKLPSFEFVTLTIYNVLGMEVATLLHEYKNPGEYSIRWDASEMPGGVYYYKLTVGTFTETKKMLLLR